MYPFFLPEIFGYQLPMYDIMIIIGVFFMLLYIGKRLETINGYTRKQANKLLILILISVFIALFSSWLFDGIFHSIEEGELAFGSITFLGGLFGGIAGFFVLYKIFFKNEAKSDFKDVMDTVIPGVVLAHGFGRIGCYCAGCCFGIPTETFLGVEFPHGHAHDLYPGEDILPTQLFESFFLFMLFFALHYIRAFRQKEIEVYLIAYGVWRILIEFIRGDDRGSLFPFIFTEYNAYPTPSQYMSLLMIIVGVVMLLKHKKQAYYTVVTE